ncbi:MULTISPECIES: arginyltransferase [unclassified Hyphomonas]|jgi:arginine-tRNA-protein transferase|uniref:arginyltransferase n=1 Tax=unclassified Hyphomonas TaxID=2630699 RepID=UPI000458B7A3|nr:MULTISPECIES: arginyltransferase [unclassified Hyphomonas]KCZ47875.1 arginyl-tRNA-protein transferase [Hyphomonas sp. CY54-11-8]RAN41174.1 arginyl-tRNA-protein transferase [Hyphomonas sp. GM-8P]
MKFTDSKILPPGLERSLRFYVTNPSPCPYLPGRKERKAFTNLSITESDLVHNLLSQSGFRRSQSIAYRPACPRCNACRSVRVPTRDFIPSRNDRRAMQRNGGLVRREVPAEPTREQYALLKSYVQTRHEGGGMSEMSYRDYAAMVGGSPVKSHIFEYRDGPEEDALLVACSITDVLRDGFSMVYTFFDPDQEGRGLGHFMILDHIRLAQDLGLPHVYLGYWVKGSPKMDYKRRYKPLEVLDGDRWRLLRDDE